MRIELSETVNRPIEEVFAFLADPANHPMYVGPVVEDSNVSEGPVHEGTTFHEEAKFLGRRLGSDWTVTRYEPPTVYEQETSIGKARLRVAFTLTSQGDGTRIDLVSEGETGGLFKLADPVVERVLRNQQQADLENLKLILESGGESAVSG